MGLDLANAAPPLVTDDAAVVDLDTWEFILSAIGESRPAVDSAELPFRGHPDIESTACGHNCPRALAV